MLVRDATRQDYQGLMTMLHALREEAPNAYPEIDEDAVEKGLDRLEHLREIGKARWFVAEDHDGLAGFLLAIAVVPIFAKGVFAGDELFYVKPEKRGSKAALMLVRALEEWSRDIAAFGTSLTFATGIKPESAGRFAQRLGYTPYGREYFKRWVS